MGSPEAAYAVWKVQEYWRAQKTKKPRTLGVDQWPFEVVPVLRSDEL